MSKFIGPTVIKYTLKERIARRFDELLPDSELKNYVDSDHMSMIEKSEETTQDVITFLEEKVNE